jgi:hypothetical protein
MSNDTLSILTANAKVTKAALVIPAAPYVLRPQPVRDTRDPSMRVSVRRIRVLSPSSRRPAGTKEYSYATADGSIRGLIKATTLREVRAIIANRHEGVWTRVRPVSRKEV